MRLLNTSRNSPGTLLQFVIFFLTSSVRRFAKMKQKLSRVFEPSLQMLAEIRSLSIFLYNFDVILS